MPVNNNLRQGWGLAYKEVNGHSRLYGTGGGINIDEIDPNTWTTLKSMTIKDKKD